MAIAKTAALQVDLDKHHTLLPGDEGGELYQELVSPLRKTLEANDLTYIYTLVGSDTPEAAEFVLDADPDPSLIGDPCEFDPAMQEAFAGEASYTKEFYSDEWGTYLSAFAPVYDDSGQVAAVLGVDMDSAEVLALEAQLRRRIYLAAVPGLLISLFLGLLLSKRISAPVKSLSSVMQTMAAEGGDLTHRLEVKGNDELGQLSQATNKMLATLQKMVASIKGVAGELQSNAANVAELTSESKEISDQIVGAFTQVTTGAQEQAASTGVVSNKATNIKEALRALATSFAQLDQEGASAQEYTSAGLGSLDDVISQIHEMAEQIKETSSLVEGLAQRSQEIEGIIAIINQIAEQTNLLALNAAIEAARAGEVGRGFAVVAEEVRKLADESKQSVSDISNLLTRINTDTTRLTQVMSENSDLAQSGVSLANSVTSAFQKISGSIDSIVAKVDDGAQVAEDTALLGDEIAQEMNKISDIAQNNASFTQEVTASGEEQAATTESVAQAAKNLEDIAVKLEEMFKQFTV